MARLAYGMLSAWVTRCALRSTSPAPWEIHYISAVPEVGDFVAHVRELWVVRKIEEDGVGPMITCDLPRPDHQT